MDSAKTITNLPRPGQAAAVESVLNATESYKQKSKSATNAGVGKGNG